MSPSSTRLDGWGLQDLRSPSVRAVVGLAKLLQLVEDEGNCPGSSPRVTHPKPGEEGHLGTRLLTVMSLVFRLWAGSRLQDVPLWQEAWAHLEAYGSGAWRGVIGGAGVTAILLELALLKGWTLAGVSVDCFKCFDIMPQAVVVRVAGELGINRGIPRALAAMQQQLRRTIWPMGTLGEWWQATSSILKGCPLSVVLINLMTSIWKMEVDDMRKHVVVATCQLPPRNVGLPLLGMPSAPRPEGAGRAAVCCTGYEDDTQAVTLAPPAAVMAEAQAVIDHTAVWMADTGRSCNAAKSTSWLPREPPDGVAPLTLGGVPILLSRELKRLAVGQRLALERGTGRVLRGRLDKGPAMICWVGCLPTFLMRETVLGSLGNSLALYGVDLADVDGRSPLVADTAAAKAILGPARCSRAKGVLCGLLAAGFYVLPVWRV